MKKFKRITAFLLALMMILSFVACRDEGETNESDEPSSSEAEITTEPAGSENTDEVTDDANLPSALELFTRAEEIADTYTSGVQTITMKMTSQGSPVSTQIYVTKKNGNNASYTVVADGYTSECIVLKDGTINYYKDDMGAYLLSDAELNDFELLIDNSDDDMFEFSNSEFFTGGTVKRVEGGYDVTIEVSDAGKEMMAESMGLGGMEISFGKMSISGKINEDGSCNEQKVYMEISMSMQGMTMTIATDATMVFTQVGENVEIDEPTGDVTYIEFGKADELITILRAENKFSALTGGSSPFEFERNFSILLAKDSASSLFSTECDIFGAYDPAKGMNYHGIQKDTNMEIKYYSDLLVVIAEEGGKKFVDSSVPVDSLFYTLITEINGTHFGLATLSSINSITREGNESVYSYVIADDYSEMVVNAYLAAYTNYTATAIKVKNVLQTVRINESGQYSSISFTLEATVTVDNVEYNMTITDTVTVKSYESATITPIVPDPTTV